MQKQESIKSHVISPRRNGVKPMREIRTTKGKLYGVLDINASVLYIRDGNITRFVKVPKEGLTLGYITGSGQHESICIPPLVS